MMNYFLGRKRTICMLSMKGINIRFLLPPLSRRLNSKRLSGRLNPKKTLKSPGERSCPWPTEGIPAHHRPHTQVYLYLVVHEWMVLQNAIWGINFPSAFFLSFNLREWKEIRRIRFRYKKSSFPVWIFGAPLKDFLARTFWEDERL